MSTKSENNVPDWVSAELFIDVLKESVKGFAKIKSFRVRNGSTAGENYATIMLRVFIDVELEDGTETSVSYMLKLPHLTDFFKKMLENNNIFESEFKMYKIYVPEMEQLYRDVGIEVKFGAKSYELKGAETDYILLEDLTPRGFKNANRLEGLDKSHCESALRRLAQWHAASVVRVATKGDYPKELIVGILKEENRAMMVEMQKSMSEKFIAGCKTYKGNEEYIEQVKDLQPRVIEGMFNMGKVDPLGCNVLNHGDFWSNNMMFSYDAFGKIRDTCLVDFQMSQYGPVAKDLYYFLLSSTKLEDKLTKFDYYIKFYHENLVKNLKLLKYSKSIPTLREIHMSLFRYGFQGYLTAVGVMSIVLLEPTEDANLENFLNDDKGTDEFKSSITTNDRYRKHIEIVLPWLLNRGALEIN
ncbi:uncharacterized protein LOC132786060 [Drosophila nasuta]|uniref:uncharacterized protein LOC132786060 n=1 Tax=Drosophila nasuta TaxID=42062 RepID=UPI00295E8DDE|nr:uncharacterized protein LOC132786060 [Drosophila nasuta]